MFFQQRHFLLIQRIRAFLLVSYTFSFVTPNLAVTEYPPDLLQDESNEGLNTCAISEHHTWSFKSRYYIYQLENKIDRKSTQNNSRCFSVIFVSIIFISTEILNNYCNTNSKVLPELFILPGELLFQLLFKTFSLNFCNEVEIVFPTPIVGMKTDFSGV